MAASTPSSSPLPAAPPSVAASPAIPFRSDADLHGDGVGLPGAALACLLVLVAAIAVLKRWGPAGAAMPGRRLRLRSVQVLESTRLADRTRVSVLRYRDREILVAHSEHAITVLSDAPAPPATGADA